MRSHTLLRRWYLSANRKYFGGRLPEDLVLAIEPCDTENAYVTKLNDGRLKLVMDTSLFTHEKYAKITLLHEMVHVKHHAEGRHRAQHGKVFQDDMLLLAKAGAFNKLW